ncbi:protein suppressor of white apricot isoform X2 [Arabidopsis lyrata subsp. lyrata]|uniref:protein suppressor of white apricot isoform X2 n=1 Tax=Arabidopsis lyrata subsp. lyrata TaxID=81972 RepID=UPI000A29EA54|nr:protein suppressor of white apricot isoform X2 [Arabidopsis lyrata subsp. lyrata]XP_020888906.1 protein suppressor of white apricot isoform X2 [Arabidopsis lyrata subsp. lyrata]XP_020888912.1 protein suppressor of white apricot isoform X2 [Arabidopsis lyrata subsp. lyrata]XP_020888919.1 protein suppressor of white apricot isoform X2 [Arabidopsis lyrata subsp. lyrata]|eukprot:XP_020888900.1 protein suppressor of white apricot isoform X2 [Arabidopsis lyrata subsp. lyrata]
MVLDTYPPTEKLHQIITRTSSFVSKHGGQSEIVLRVKQGGNPTFGFLMPDHHLHPYFRFLVDHQELLTGKSSVEEKKNESEKDGGALFLLGSVYGTVEDEDANEESANDSKTSESAKGDDGVKVTDSNGPEWSKGAVKIASKHSLPLNDQASVIKRNPSVSAVNVVERKQINTEDNATEKLLTSDKSQPKLELQIVEPSTEMKRVIDKIVDFIQKNGKELEATLVAQDVKNGMFPFLRPASLYHAYYRKVLQEAEELKSCDKGVITRKEDVKQEKMGNAVKDGKYTFGSVLPDDSAKKEKLKVVSDKPKVELHNESFKPVQPQMRVNVDANTAAAILQAARRGIRNPQLGILSGKPMDETSQSLGNDGSYPSSKSPDLAKSSGQSLSGSTAPSEADSSEAGLSKEQKLKAERLKRAKMFVAKLKPDAHPVQQAEPSRSISVEPLDSGISGLGANAAKERDSSSIPSVAETKLADDGNSERRPKRNYRSRSHRDEDVKMEQEEGEEEESSMDEVTEETKTDKKHSSSRKRHIRHKHKTRYSSKDRHSRDKHKHASSSDDEYHSRSRHRHRYSKSSDRHELYDSSDNEGEHRHRSSKHSKDVDYSKDKRSHHHRSRKHDKHRDSSDDEHHHYNRHRSSRRKHEDSSEDEHGHRHKSSKRIKKDEKTVEEEAVSKSDQSDLKASPEDNIQYPRNEPTQVSDELRAKIRAMLADTLGDGR